MKNLVNKTETGLVNNIGEYRERYANCTSIIDDLDWFEDTLADVRLLENIFSEMKIKGLHLFDCGQGGKIYDRMEKYIESHKDHANNIESGVLKDIEAQGEVDASQLLDMMIDINNDPNQELQIVRVSGGGEDDPQEYGTYDITIDDEIVTAVIGAA